MISVIGVDPGPAESAFMCLDAFGKPVRFGKISNERMIEQLDFERIEADQGTTLAVEMVASYGMPVGAEVFETCVWLGRFIERWRGRHAKILRVTVRSHICRSMKADDSNIRAALIERFGPSKAVAIGTKSAPGPLYGVVKDVWSALAVAVTHREREPGTGRGLLR